jgi:hypothetical protein
MIKLFHGIKQNHYLILIRKISVVIRQILIIKVIRHKYQGLINIIINIITNNRVLIILICNLYNNGNKLFKYTKKVNIKNQ